MDAGTIKDFGDCFEDNSTVLFSDTADWVRIMFVAWSSTEIEALEDVFSQESRILERCEDTKNS